MTQARRFLVPLLAALAPPLFPLSAWAQCAMCRASLLNSQGGGELLEGLRQGVIFLLAIPLIIAAMVLIRLQRASGASAESAGQPGLRSRESGGCGAFHNIAG